MQLEKVKRRNFKKIGIVVFTVVCVLLITGAFIFSSFASFETKETRAFINGNVVDPGDISFSFYVDGVIARTIPSKNTGYIFEKGNCTNGASVEWLNDEWAPKILDFTQTRTKCTLYFRTETAVDVILAKGETEELKFDNTTDNNLRYIGANPNNYVSFNNELWRIIGVFNNIDNGSGTKETRIKIIRDESLGNNSFDSGGPNSWATASINSELNGSYFDSMAESNKAMIGDAGWYLGGMSGNSADANYYPNGLVNDWYFYERSTKVYDGRETTWNGKIGLMYVSDYGYAVGGQSRDTCLNLALSSWDSNASCYDNDWLFNGEVWQWTLTPNAGNSGGVFNIRNYGSVFSSNANVTSAVICPTLYLKANTRIISGTGEEANPYILSL